MRHALIFACLLIPFAAAAQAQDAASITCQSIIANAERGGMHTQMAIGTYFHGKHMGQPCVDVDYDRAFALAQQFGISFDPWAKILRDRAAQGHPTAISALDRLGY